MTEVDRLTGTEGGRWRIWTQGSTHTMDLDAMTVTRHPGPTSGRTINDTTRRIREIRQCQIGQSGYWTMSAGGLLDQIESYWQLTTPISKIERIDDDEAHCDRVSADLDGGTSVQGGGSTDVPGI